MNARPRRGFTACEAIDPRLQARIQFRVRVCESRPTDSVRQFWDRRPTVLHSSSLITTAGCTSPTDLDTCSQSDTQAADGSCRATDSFTCQSYPRLDAFTVSSPHYYLRLDAFTVSSPHFRRHVADRIIDVGCRLAPTSGWRC